MQTYLFIDSQTSTTYFEINKIGFCSNSSLSRKKKELNKLFASRCSYQRIREPFHQTFFFLSNRVVTCRQHSLNPGLPPMAGHEERGTQPAELKPAGSSILCIYKFIYDKQIYIECFKEDHCSKSSRKHQLKEQHHLMPNQFKISSRHQLLPKLWFFQIKHLISNNFKMKIRYVH